MGGMQSGFPTREARFIFFEQVG